VCVKKRGKMMSCFAAVFPAAAVFAAAKGRERERERSFCGVRMKRERVLPNEIVLFIPLLFILQSLP